MQKIKVKDVVVQKLEWKLTNRQKNGWIWLNLIFSSVMQLVITITSILTPFNMGSWLIHFSICYGRLREPLETSTSAFWQKCWNICWTEHHTVNTDEERYRYTSLPIKCKQHFQNYTSRSRLGLQQLIVVTTHKVKCKVKASAGPSYCN